MTGDDPMTGNDLMTGGGGSPASAKVAQGTEDRKRSAVEAANCIVFDLVKSKLPQGSTQQDLNQRESAIRNIVCKHGHGRLAVWLQGVITMTYPSLLDDAFIEEAADKAATALMSELDGTSSEYSPDVKDPDLRQRLLVAFTEPNYHGDAKVKFVEYLQRCWLTYCANHDKYKAPYTAIVQSSGFGKSRLLYELALETAKRDDLKMRVLYSCTREKESTGFPAATVKMMEWLFASGQDEIQLSRHLVAAYHYAQENWLTVGSDWLELFTDTTADGVASEALRNTEAKLWPPSSKEAGPSKKSGPSSAKSNESKTVEAVAETEEVRTKLKNASNGSERVLILAVDEARTLLTWHNRGIDYYRLLRRALTHANALIRKEMPKGGIFAVLVDTNSKVSDLIPPVGWGPSNRYGKPTWSLTLFPPFVLTHTMDVFWRAHVELTKPASVSAYKSVVSSDNAEKAWMALVSMGRPMWASMYRASVQKLRVDFKIEALAASQATKRLLELSARKLLVGLDPSDETSFNGTTMFGVASMLSRLGLRPYSTSALASRVVADFMSILAYVNFENDGLLASYASDPVLALGATRVWYLVDSALPRYILPQFKKLLMYEVLEVGGVEEVAVRIVLLLVMDACVVMEVNGPSPQYFPFTGQFVDVESFLLALGGDSIPVMLSKQKVANKKMEEAYKRWRSQWGGWKMGFCHFMQLDREPIEEMLWVLLGRRAAGVLPHGHNGADLLIPIYSGSNVSMILVQVKNVEKRDSKYPESAKAKMHPSYVFSTSNSLRCKSSLEVIRVYVSLREPVPDRNPDRYVLVELGGALDPKTTSESKEAGPSDECSGATSAPKKKKKKKKTTTTTKKETSKPSAADTTSTSSKHAEATQTAKSDESNAAFTLCIRSIGAWELSRGGAAYPIVSKDVVAKLTDLITSIRDPMGVVRSDLSDRRAKEAKSSGVKCLSPLMPDGELEEIASRVMMLSPGLGDELTADKKEKTAAAPVSAVASSFTVAKKQKTRPQ